MAMTKSLSASNFLSPDAASALFVRLGDDGRPVQLTASDWAQTLDRLRLTEAVPDDIRELYDTAVGCLYYGFFFYPLYALGEEQLFRVCEVAAKARCATEGRQTRTFARAIDALLELGVIKLGQMESWQGLRRLRNAASHPEFQMLTLPGDVVTIADRVRAAIESLFLRNTPE